MLRLVSAGLANKQIARELGISVHTVERHVTNLYAKIGWDTEFWPPGPTGFGVDYTKGENISSEGAEGQSYGIAAVQRIQRDWQAGNVEQPRGWVDRAADLRAHLEGTIEAAGGEVVPVLAEPHAEMRPALRLPR